MGKLSNPQTNGHVSKFLQPAALILSLDGGHSNWSGVSLEWSVIAWAHVCLELFDVKHSLQTWPSICASSSGTVRSSAHDLTLLLILMLLMCFISSYIFVTNPVRSILCGCFLIDRSFSHSVGCFCHSEAFLVWFVFAYLLFCFTVSIFELLIKKK